MASNYKTENESANTAGARAADYQDRLLRRKYADELYANGVRGTGEGVGVDKGQTTPSTTTPDTKPRGPGDGTPAAATTPNYDRTVPTVFGDTVDPNLQAQYQNAMQTLEQMKGKAPTYGSQYDAQIQDLYQQIIGRGPFKYDQKVDPLYQQYVQDYTTQGKMAMRDTMGRAAGLTGGYGSSYAQAVGQQQYDQYLQKMADILPETYGMALNAYNAEGDQLNSKLATTTGLEQSDYNRYLDALNQHNLDVQRAQTDADTWYERMTADEQKNYNRQLDKYQLQKEYYNRLMGLISAGYTPSKEDYAAAGLSEAQGAALRAQYAPAPASSSRGGGPSRPGTTDDDKEFTDLLTGILAQGAIEDTASKTKQGATSASPSTAGKTNQGTRSALQSIVDKIKKASGK